MTKATKKLGRGKYLLKKPKPDTTTTINFHPNVPYTDPRSMKVWPKITLKRQKQDNTEFIPVCFTSYKILHAMDRLYYSRELITALEETGLLIEIQDA